MAARSNMGYFPYVQYLNFLLNLLGLPLVVLRKFDKLSLIYLCAYTHLNI